MMRGRPLKDAGRERVVNAGILDGPSGVTRPARWPRRLSDKILIAFHQACDQADFEVAEQLLHILEMVQTRQPLTHEGDRRRNMDSLVAAHERLWLLRHPHEEQGWDMLRKDLLIVLLSVVLSLLGFEIVFQLFFWRPVPRCSWPVRCLLSRPGEALHRSSEAGGVAAGVEFIAENGGGPGRGIQITSALVSVHVFLFLLFAGTYPRSAYFLTLRFWWSRCAGGFGDLHTEAVDDCLPSTQYFRLLSKHEFQTTMTSYYQTLDIRYRSGSDPSLEVDSDGEHS
jgi:hypothetical protein